MLNLSRFPQRNAHINLLSKRPKFFPTVSRSNLNLKSDSKELTRKLKCREKFWNIEFEDDSLWKTNIFYNPANPSQKLSNVNKSMETGTN